jgi:surface carbohydrate biosynthesis protein
MTKYLVIPLEIKNRELLPTCNLIAEALKKDWTVIVGQKQQIFPFIKNLPKSVWYLKSLVPGENSLIKKIKKFKHIITSLDIEGLITANIPDTLKQRYSIENIELVDAIFFWGQNHYNLFKNSFKNFNPGKVFVTGSPVADQWLLDSKNHHNQQNQKIDSILIIPSFGYAATDSSGLRIKLAFDNAGVKRVQDSNDISRSILENIKKDEESHKAAFESFIELIKKLCAKYPHFNIILRPHPNENKDLWTSKLENYKNLIIDKNEDKYKQISRSKAIIHFNSTMSIQSSLMKKKTILYNAIDKKFKDIINPVNLKISSYCENFDELTNIIDNDKFEYKENYLKEILKHTEYDKENNSSLSIAKVIDQLKSKLPKDQSFDEKIFFEGLYSRYLSTYYHLINFYIVPFLSYFSFISYLKRFAHGSIYRDHKISRRKIMETKWKNITTKEFREILEPKIKERGLNKKIKINQHFSGMFFVSSTK